MGIANSTAATALLAAFSGMAPHAITGRGTGIDDATWERKVTVIEKALAVNPSAGKPALEILAALGGFEIAALAGVVLGGFRGRVGNPALLPRAEARTRSTFERSGR